MAGELQKAIRAAAPEVSATFDALCAQWLAPLAEGLDEVRPRPKQVNDAVWGTVELFPWEVALLDTPLFQRMRGVRQLGLAYLVFPGAVHDRLEHLIGVVAAVETMMQSLSRQIERRNGDDEHKGPPLPVITPRHRYRLRLAAMFHDLGHGPFSHAIEPVLEVSSPLGEGKSVAEGTWRGEISKVRTVLKSTYGLNSIPAVSEVISVMMIMSSGVTELLRDHRFATRLEAPPTALQEELVACVVGAVNGPGADHLSALISSQLDADRMDYLSRDAHHAGLPMGFDTARLLSRMEVLELRDDNTPGADDATRVRIANAKGNPVYQIGIAASGFGSFEQMLIGRTFLYDRLYHHHKVRAAEAMAQRMLLVAERDRGKRLSLEEIFLPVGDDTLLRLFAEEISHKSLQTSSGSAAMLADGILKRRLLHRAYAFRARLIATPGGLEKEDAESVRDKKWRDMLKGVANLAARYEVGVKIHGRALEVAEVLASRGIDPERMQRFADTLKEIGPEQIIVDLFSSKASAIRIMARYPDGSVKVPESSFNPVKWADAYDLQKGTGYVFCPREVMPIVALAANIEFLVGFGVVMSSDANGFIKAGTMIEERWLEAAVEAGLLDRDAADLISTKKHSLLSLREEDMAVPAAWVVEDPNFRSRLKAQVNRGLPAGLTKLALDAFTRTMGAMFAFVDAWMDGDEVTGEVSREKDLQDRLKRHLRMLGLKVVEGSEVGGGELDLFVDDHVLIENKYKGTPTPQPTTAHAGAGRQGRRYAIALRSQLVITVAAVRVGSQEVPERTKLVSVRQPSTEDANRVEIRFTVPFGAAKPSSA